MCSRDLVIFFIAFFATILSAMSGGGSAMITTPVWILMGFPLPVAQATNKVNGVLWLPIAARNYLRHQKVDWKLLIGMIVFGSFGAYLGNLAFIGTDFGLLKRIFGLIILAQVGLVLRDRGFGEQETESKTSRLTSSLFSIPLGFYEGFFGSGNGIFTSAMLVKTRGMNLITALGYYYLAACFWCFFSAAFFLKWGYGDWNLIIPSTLGGVLGAYIGSYIGRRKGTKFVKIAFVTIGVILGLKLTVGI